MRSWKFFCVSILMSIVGLSFSSGNDNVQPFDSDNFYPYNLFVREGRGFLVGVVSPAQRRMPPFDRTSLPEMPRGGGIGRIDTQTIDRWKDRSTPFYTEHLSKYPALISREEEFWEELKVFPLSGASGKELQEKRKKLSADEKTILRQESSEAWRLIETKALPRFQAVPEWVNYSGVFQAEMYEIDLRKWEASELIPRLGALRKREPYFRRPVSVRIAPDVKQPRADMIKPFLFYAGNRFYSVYGDTQVAEHVTVDDHPEYLAALRHPGNILYGYSEELPPALQACGMDGNGYLWLADIEGHIAFFNTNTNEYVQEVLRKKDADRVRIARDNRSSSVFISRGYGEQFEEYSVRIGDDLAFLAPPMQRALATTGEFIEVPANRRLPANTEQILYSNRSKVIAVVGDGGLLKLKGGRRQYLSSGAPHDEYIVEGLYNPDTGIASLLVAKKWRKDAQWNTILGCSMRLIRISVSEDKKLESRLPNILGE